MSLADFLDPKLRRRVESASGAAYRPPGGGSGRSGGRYGRDEPDQTELPTGPRDRSGGGYDDRGYPIRRGDAGFDDEGDGAADLATNWRSGGNAPSRDREDDRRGGRDRYDDRERERDTDLGGFRRGGGSSDRYDDRDRRGGSDRYDDRRGGRDRYDDRERERDTDLGSFRRGGGGSSDRYDDRDRRGGSDRYDDRRSGRGGFDDRRGGRDDAPAARPRLQLKKRTAPVAAPAAAAPGGDAVADTAAAAPAASKSNPFGAARPVVTKDAAEAAAAAAEPAADDKWAKAFKSGGRRPRPAAAGGAANERKSPRPNDRFAALAEADRERPAERAPEASRFTALAAQDRSRDDDAPPTRDTGAAERFAALADPDRVRDDDARPAVDPSNNRFAKIAATEPRDRDFERPRSNDEAFANFAGPRDRRDDRDDDRREFGSGAFGRRRDDRDDRDRRDDREFGSGSFGRRRDDRDDRDRRDDREFGSGSFGRRRDDRDDRRRGDDDRRSPRYGGDSQRDEPRRRPLAGLGGAGRSRAAPAPVGPTNKMDDELYVSTLKQKARGILDVYLNDPSLTAEDDALRSFAELGERQFYPKIVTLSLLRAPRVDTPVELTLLADLLLGLRKSKPAVMTLGQFVAGVEEAVTHKRVVGNAAAEEAVAKLAARVVKDGAIPAEVLPEAVTAALARFAPGVVATGAGAGAGAAESGAGAGAGAAAPEEAVAVDEVVAGLVEGGKAGEELLAEAKARLAGHEAEAAGPLVEGLLQRELTADRLASGACFEADQLGAMLTWLLFDHSDRCVSALRAIIRVLNGVGFPKGLVERVFMHLYDKDVIPDTAFLKWKGDYDDETEGRQKAIFQLLRWFQWLQEDDEESEEDSGSEEEDD